MNTLLLVGLSHKSAPVEVRERLDTADLGETLRTLAGVGEEAVVLSTCNRFEIYLSTPAGREVALRWIRERAHLGEEELRPHLYVREGRNACKHLFFVASALDSLVIGETQIRGQVKKAYEAAREAQRVGPFFHQLFRAPCG